MGLHSLPACIFKLTALKNLHLENNQLTTLPDTVGNLTALKYLKLGHNRLATLPSAVCNLTALEHLSLSHNELTTLPNVGGNLTALKILTLHNNELATLPDAVGNLTALENLHLENNQLTTLPDTVGNLTAIKYLKLGHNKLATLPDAVGNLTVLENLYLGHNKLTTLPNAVGNLTSLKYLYSGNNQLATLPDAVGNLTELKCLSLSNNHLTTLPDSLSSLTELSNFHLDGNPLTVLSETIRNMPAFKNAPDKEELLHLLATLPPSEPTESSSSVTSEISNTHLLQVSLTPEQHRRIADLLDTPNTPAHATLTPEQHDRVIKVLSMEDAINAAVANSPVSEGKTLLSQPALERLIEIAQITFANELEKRQWEAEIGALMTQHPNTGAQGLLLYNLVSSGLTGQFNNTAHITSGAGGASHGMATSVGTTAITLAGGLTLVPWVGNQLATGAKTVVTTIDGKRITRNLNRGLHAMASVGNTGTRQQQQEAMARLVHGVSYRLALHRCGKESRNTGAVKQAIKSGIGIDDRSVNNFQTYVQKITDAILQPETFKDADAEMAVTRLVTAALARSALGDTVWRRASRDEMALAEKLGEKHQEIIEQLATDATSTAGTQAVPAARIGTAPASVVVTDALSLRRQAAWVRPTIAVLPDVVRGLDIVELAAGEVTPKIQRLLDRIHGSNDADQVMDAGERLDTRIRMKRSEQQNALLLAEVQSLRGDLQSLTDKPADPAISELRQGVDGLAQRQNEMHPRLTAAQNSATSAHDAILELKPQLQAMQTTLDSLVADAISLQASLADTPANDQFDELGRRVETLGNEKAHLEKTVNQMTKKMTRLEDAVDPDANGGGGGGQMLMPTGDRAQGKALMDQHAHLERLKAHVDQLSLAVVEMREQLGMDNLKPAGDPDNLVGRKLIFGHLLDKAKRK